MLDVSRKALPRATEIATRHLDAAIRALADAQFGVISLDQLRALGLTAAGVRARVKRGALVPLHRGVYAVGHGALRREGHFMAAVLACGDRACLSHASAAAHRGMRQSAARRIDVTVPHTNGRSRPGIRVHRSTTLSPADVTVVDGIPTTSVARTLLDLADVLDEHALAKAFAQAEILRILDMRAVRDVIERNPGRHGLRPLRALLSSLDPRTQHSRNDLELVFHWPQLLLVAETDGWETHGTRRAFERDRHRDQLLLRAGYRTVRFTWRQVMHDRAWVAQTVRSALRANSEAAGR